MLITRSVGDSNGFGIVKSLPVGPRQSCVSDGYITLSNSKYVHLETSDEAQSRIEAGPRYQYHTLTKVRLHETPV